MKRLKVSVWEERGRGERNGRGKDQVGDGQEEKWEREQG